MTNRKLNLNIEDKMNNVIVVCMLMFLSLNTAVGQEWQTDFAKAKKTATAENRPIILVFQGSDWCAPCIKLDREVWSTKIFIDYAATNYVMVQADFPRRKKNALSDEQTKANAKLAEAYNKNGVFPFVVVLDHTGAVLGETSYKKTTPQTYIDELNAFAK
jgi:thioredoxin-related protein